MPLFVASAMLARSPSNRQPVGCVAPRNPGGIASQVKVAYHQQGVVALLNPAGIASRDVGLDSKLAASPLTIGLVHQRQRSRCRRKPVRYKNLSARIVDSTTR